LSGGQEGKLSELPCAVLCTTVVHNDTHIREQFLKMNVGFRFSFNFLCACLGLAFCVFFCFSLDYFVVVLFTVVVLGLVSSVLSQEIGWEERLRNDPILCRVGRKTFTVNACNVVFSY